MRNWRELNGSNTMQDLINYFNLNSESSKFLDSMIGTILSNGIIFSGKETINGMIIAPLKSVELTGVVGSATVLDNFTLYFRDTNKVVELNQFPIDLLSYANGKPQFLYIREDLSYRVSDYMFGEADEVLLARFVINTDSTWNQFYIMAQRAGTPIYNAADEFYTVDGMYVKSPGGLELSQTSGTVKRSGIEFNDRVSPDIYEFYNLASERVPLRYINNYNEIDYTQNTVYNIITNKYLTYNLSQKLKVQAEQYIRNIRNMFYMIQQDSAEIALELHTMIVDEASQTDLLALVDSYHDRILDIYAEVDKLYDLLGDQALSTVRRAGLLTNKTDINTYMDTNLTTSVITESNVEAINTVPKYIVSIDLTYYQEPLDIVLQEIQDELSNLSFNAGTLNNVPAGKFTIQRVLWDVYEKTLIMQYGDRIYDTFNDAINGTGLVEYPAPYGKTIYIPLAIMVVKSGISSINADTETLILDRRWIEVDQELTGYSDYIARAQSQKAIDTVTKLVDGTLASMKADSLKHTVSGATVYDDGDYFLEYSNLKNRVTVINNLTTSTYNATQALSAYQGYVLNTNKLDKSGGTMTGTLTTRGVVPSANNTYDLGANGTRWNRVYANAFYANSASISGNTAIGGTLSVTGAATMNSSASIAGNATVGGNLTVTGNLNRNAGGVYVYSSNSSILNAVAGVSNLSGYGNKTIDFTW